jgi:hypothetical protein
MLVIAFFLVVGAAITLVAIPGDRQVRVGQAPVRKGLPKPSATVLR